jgi:hypothetical protein
VWKWRRWWSWWWCVLVSMCSCAFVRVCLRACACV